MCVAGAVMWVVTGEHPLFVAGLVVGVGYLLGVLFVEGSPAARDGFGLFVSAQQVAIVGPFADVRLPKDLTPADVEFEVVRSGGVDKLAVKAGAKRHPVSWVMRAPSRHLYTWPAYRTPNVLYARQVRSVSDAAGEWMAVQGVEWDTEGAVGLVARIREAQRP